MFLLAQRLFYEADEKWGTFGSIEEETIDVSDAMPYTGTEDMENVNISYSRTFNNTDLQPLYVPFSMSYTDWCEDFDVFRINAFHEYDRNNDGVIDDQLLKVIKVTETCGDLKPNYPYLIRAKTEGDKTITLKNTTLHAAEGNSIDCSTVSTRYTFTGTYSPIGNLLSSGYYAMKGGKLCPAASDDVKLGAFRWYLQVEDRGSSFVHRPAQISIRIDGEDTTGIDCPGDSEVVNDGIYAIDGRNVSNWLPARGIYIKNGKKFYVK